MYNVYILGNMSEIKVLRLKAGDNVGVALRDLASGDALTPETGAARGAIPFGHKVALRSIAAGEVIHRLGQPIGIAGADIPAGAHVHVHNMGFEASMAGHAIGTRLSNAPRLPAGAGVVHELTRRPIARLGVSGALAGTQGLVPPLLAAEWARGPGAGWLFSTDG